MVIFVASVILTALVFSPLGFSHGGATRWLDFGLFTIQPSEFLKIGFIIYLAAWLVDNGKKMTNKWSKSYLPLLVSLVAISAIMLGQPDMDNYLILILTGMVMLFVATGKVKILAYASLVGLMLMVVLAFTRPYVMDRLTAFIQPEADPLGSGYQINQSLIAIGSGGLVGKGLGQSIQKFGYLPEPNNDSIFAVLAEEFGFIGSVVVMLLFTTLICRGYTIASRCRNQFGVLLMVGFVTLLALQAFINIASMVNLVPLGGLALPFISHGGSALLSLLVTIGIMLNISKYQAN